MKKRMLSIMMAFILSCMMAMTGMSMEVNAAEDALLEETQIQEGQNEMQTEEEMQTLEDVPGDVLENIGQEEKTEEIMQTEEATQEIMQTEEATQESVQTEEATQESLQTEESTQEIEQTEDETQKIEGSLQEKEEEETDEAASALQTEVTTEVKHMEASSFDEFAKVTAELIEENDTQNGRQGIDMLAQAHGEYVTKRLIVKSKGVSLDLSDVGAETVIAGPNNIYILQFLSEELTENAAKYIQNLSEVEYCEADSYDKISNVEEASLVQAEKSAATATEYFSWGAKKIGVDKYAQYVQSNCKDTSIVIAVLDSGIEKSQSFFQGKIAPGEYDYVNTDSDASDDNGHGTHVTGTVLDCMRGLNAKILPIKILDQYGYGSHINIANGFIRAAIEGASVINYSVGGSHSQYKEDAIEYARDEGCVVVVAAGNDNIDITRYAECPAHMKECIVVGSVDETNIKSSFSNYGETLDIVAPGSYILSTYIGNQYVYMSGTSMACPHVSSVAAMFRLMYPSYTPSQIETLIKQYKQDLGATGKDIYYGYGIPDLSKAILKSPFTTSYKSTYSRVYEAGKTEQLDIRAKTKLSYKSSNTAVAKVNSSGKVTLTGCGKAVITVTAEAGVGYYTDEKEITFTVTPKKQKITSLVSVSGTKGFTVSYTENTAGTGYQVRYATQSNFSDGVTKKVLKNSILTYTIPDLLEGQTYYVKVRTYKAKNGSYYYGKYSDPIKIKISSATDYKSTYSRVYEAGKTEQLDTTGMQVISCESSDTAVAKVSNSGKVTLTGCGKAVITVVADVGEGYGTLSREITFTVTPKKQKVTSLTSGSGTKSFTVSYTENTAGTGYQVRYATQSNFSDGVTVNVSQNSILTHTVPNLSEGQIYYVKVRTYKAKNGSYYYGKYSDPVKIKIS